jgi:hypothetical protein
MASRDLLARHKLDDFTKWLVEDGWTLIQLTEKKKQALICLQAKKEGRQHPITVWFGRSPKRLSVLDRDEDVVREYIKSRKELLSK